MVSFLDAKNLLTPNFLILHNAPPHSSTGSLHQFEVKFDATRGADVSNLGKMLPIEALICLVLAKINVLAVVSH